MGDLLFSISFIALIAIAVLAGRSMARFAVLTLSTVMGSGALLQFLSSKSLSVTFPLLQWWLLVTAVILAALSIWFGRGDRASGSWRRSSNVMLVGTSLLVTVAFLVSRLLAPGELSPLSSVGFFVAKVSAEDNAKWLNATSQLAGANVIDTWANVGGPLLLVMSLGATLIGALSFLLYGSINEVAVSAGSVIFTQVFLIIIAPFALAPIVEKSYRKLTCGRQLPRLYSLLGIGILVASTTVLMDYGHITLQFTLITLTLWIATFLAPLPRFPGRLLTTLSVVVLSMVWFPLSGLSLAIIIGSIAFFTRALLRKGQPSRKHAIIGLAASIGVFVLTIEFLISALGFSLGINQTDTAAGGLGLAVVGGIAAAARAISAPTLPLFDDPGGTETMTTLLLVLTLVSVLGLVWVKIGRQGFTKSQLIPFIPIVLAGGYALAIAFADFWAVGSGPNYGSLKISFAVFLPILVASLPFALLTFNQNSGIKRSVGITGLGFAAIGVIVVLLTLDTLLPRAVLQLKPANWPSVSGGPYWYPAEVRDTGDQSLTTNPIGCVFLPRGAQQPTVLPSGQTMYTCTRLLSGVAGVETAAAPIVKWQLDEWLQNRELWSEMQPYFDQMNPQITNRQLILLDLDKQVIGVESLSSLVQKYQPLAQ